MEDIIVPSGTRCEFCGMLAVKGYVGPEGATHFVCEHHLPVGQETRNENNVARHDRDAFHHESPITNHQSHDHPSPTGSSVASKHAGHSVNMFRDKFWVSLAVTVPTVLLSPMFQQLFGINFAFPGSIWIPFVGGTFLFFYGGSVFLKSASGELKAKLPGMMTLISLAIIAAYGWSLAATFLGIGGDFFWELATLITVMLLGHWIEMKSVADASGALKELAKLLPDTAERIPSASPPGTLAKWGRLGDSSSEVKEAVNQIVPLSEVRLGDLLLVRPGTKIPVDGEVVEGTTSINESMVTGESVPVEKHVGSSLIAGTVNTTGAITIRATKVGADTALSGIMRLVTEAQASQSRTQLLADKAAFALTIIAVVVGFTTLVTWLAVGQSPAFAFERLVTVLVIACPHALGLAVPLVTSISTTLAAKNGVLVRKRIALEAARQVDVVMFDKTGTLTTGEFGVVNFVAVAGKKPNDILAVAAAVEAASEHPLAQAMTAKAIELKLTLPSVRGTEAIPGQGVKAKLLHRWIMVGGPQLLAAEQLDIPAGIQVTTDEAADRGQTIVYVVDDGKIVGAIALADQIRPESKTAVQNLHALGVKIAMVTGDSRAVAQGVAKQLGIDTVFAEVLPQDKVEKIKSLQQEHQRVMMVGDGVNDAAALSTANVGVAIGAGTDVAIESAGIVLMRNDPRDIVKIITLARATYQKTIQNLVWATGYNVIAIPLAAGVLASRGILLAPAVGAILMSASTVIVAANAQLLRRLKF